MLGDVCVERRTDPELIGGFTAAYGGKFWGYEHKNAAQTYDGAY